MSKEKVYFKSMVGSSVVMLGKSFRDLSSSGMKDGFGLVSRSFMGAETLPYTEVVRSVGSSSMNKIGSLDQAGVARGFDHFSLEVSEEIKVVRSAVNCFKLQKQPLGPLDKNHP
jgi:tRNA splicing ligase